jgi:signal transduction histidine kinase
VKSICAAHGAEVEVLSAPGQGSTFRVRQPLAADVAAGS